MAGNGKQKYKKSGNYFHHKRNEVTKKRQPAFFPNGNRSPAPDTLPPPTVRKAALQGNTAGQLSRAA